MGYSTDFEGRVEVSPPLNAEEIEFLTKFNETRRMDRANGPYFVAGSGFMGQGQDPDIRDFNRPAEGQPGLWCQWRPTEDGTAIEWDGGEKFYDADTWMTYLVEHFLKPGARAKAQLPFLQGHQVNGIIHAAGEDPNDRWAIQVEHNRVTRLEGTTTYG
jgi:hypothetical protein